MKGEKDTASNTDSSRPSSPIPTLFLSPLTIPPDSAGEGVAPAPDRLLDPHPLAHRHSQAWPAPLSSAAPDEFLTPRSTTLTYLHSEARVEATDKKDLSGQATEEPCWECIECTIS